MMTRRYLQTADLALTLSIRVKIASKLETEPTSKLGTTTAIGRVTLAFSGILRHCVDNSTGIQIAVLLTRRSCTMLTH
jgi:hypothetical protein